MSDSKKGQGVRVNVHPDTPEAVQSGMVIAGASFTEELDDTGKLRHVYLPTGWTAEGSGKGSDPCLVRDVLGRVRAVITAGQLTSVERYEVRLQHSYTTQEDRSSPRGVRAVVVDNADREGEGVVYATDWNKTDEESGRIVRAEAEAWLDREHPRWRLPISSWKS